MRVLHITNEFTKKNYSIASLILFISKYLYKSYGVRFSLLSSKTNKFLFSDEIFTQINFNKWSSFFLLNKEFKKKIYNYDIIHIHGIWAPIQLFSILICNKQNFNFVVHPHGMLLPEALSSGGIIKYFFKLFSLFFLKKILKRNLNFISITNQETNAIKKYFPKANVNLISNPIPFHISKIKNKKKKKRFVYFGRIHPHKNLDILIEAFLVAKLPSDWCLEIYGIRDNENYFYKLKKLIGISRQVKIKQPIFGKEKQKVMQQSWANILISKSEVVSLSILESSAYGLPSLINKNIEVIGLEKSVISTNLSLENIQQKIKDISNWSYKKRFSVGKKLFKQLDKKISMKAIAQKYNNFYKTVNSKPKEKLVDFPYFQNFSKSYNLNFLMISGSYMFNLMFPSLLVVMFVIMGKFSIAGELGLVASFWITLTQIFSSNMRSIIISEQKLDYAVLTIYYRFTFSLIAFLIFFIASNNFIFFENTNLIYLVSLLILFQWINEMNLVQFEVKNKNPKFGFIILINILTTILATLLIYLSELKLLSYLLFVYILYILIESLINFLKFDTIKKNFISLIFKLNIQTIAFVSSFSIIISSFAWKIMIYFIFNKSLAGIFFACFSIGSFPGTLFNSVIGPAFIKNKMQIPNLLKKIFFITFLLLVIILTYSINSLNAFKSVDFLSSEFIYFTTTISLIGSYFMCYAMYLRHKQIQISYKERSVLFKTDILYGISITFIIPILYYFGGTTSVSFSYLAGSFVALILYSLRQAQFNKLKVKLG